MTSSSSKLDAGLSGPLPRRRRGLLDFVLLCALGYGVYAATPLGAVVETAIRVARGQKDHPSWFATFRGRDLGSASTEQVDALRSALVTGGLPAPVVLAAKQADVDVNALAALVAARGSCDTNACTLAAPDRLMSFVPGTVGTVDVAVVARGLKAAKAALKTDSDELSIEALFLGMPALDLARAQAQRSGLEGADDVEVHAPFLSPGQRRGPLQGALAVLLVHRLRTLAWPAEGFRITSPFGERIHPVTGRKSFHNGTDLGVPTGTLLHAAHQGVIKRASVDSISGQYVILDHGLGIQTTYCHMSHVGVVEKKRIARKAVIGASGATGRVTGPHLHYILRLQDKAVDAATYGEGPSARGLQTPPTPTTAPTKTPPTAPTKRVPTKTPTKTPSPDLKGKSPAEDAASKDAASKDAASKDAVPEDAVPKPTPANPHARPSTEAASGTPPESPQAATPPAPDTGAASPPHSSAPKGEPPPPKPADEGTNTSGERPADWT